MRRSRNLKRSVASREILNTSEAAVFIGCSARYLEQLRSNQEGPAFSRLPGNDIRYFRTSLIAWVASLERPSLKTEVVEISYPEGKAVGWLAEVELSFVGGPFLRGVFHISEDRTKITLPEGWHWCEDSDPIDIHSTVTLPQRYRFTVETCITKTLDARLAYERMRKGA